MAVNSRYCNAEACGSAVPGRDRNVRVSIFKDANQVLNVERIVASENLDHAACLSLLQEPHHVVPRSYRT